MEQRVVVYADDSLVPTDALMCAIVRLFYYLFISHLFIAFQHCPRRTDFGAGSKRNEGTQERRNAATVGKAVKNATTTTNCVCGAGGASSLNGLKILFQNIFFFRFVKKKYGKINIIYKSKDSKGNPGNPGNPKAAQGSMVSCTPCSSSSLLLLTLPPSAGAAYQVEATESRATGGDATS